MIQKPQGLRCYATLGVSPYADSKALTSAYRRLSLQIHPDKNSNTVEAKEKFQHLKDTLDYLKDDASRKEYDQIVATAYAQISRELDDSYKKLHEVRQKIRHSEILHVDLGTNAGWHNGITASDMNKESQIVKLIKLQLQELAALNGEIRQVPAKPVNTRPTDHLVPRAVDYWRTSAQHHAEQVKSLQEQVTIQQKAVEMTEAEINRLRAENKTLRHTVSELGRENDRQKELVREKTAEVDALKEQISFMDAEDSKRKESSKIVQEEKDLLRELNTRLLEEIKAFKEERARQQAEFNKLKEKETRLEVERNTMRNIQKVREEQQQPQGKVDYAAGHKDRRPKVENRRPELESPELKNDMREPEEVKRELERETDKVSEKATATSNTRYGTCPRTPRRSNTKRSKAGKRFRSPEEAEESTTSEGGDISITTKRPCPRAGKWSDSHDLFTPSLNIPSSVVPSGGLLSVNNGSVAAESVAIVRKETSPEPR